MRGTETIHPSQSEAIALRWWADRKNVNRVTELYTGFASVKRSPRGHSPVDRAAVATKAVAEGVGHASPSPPKSRKKRKISTFLPFHSVSMIQLHPPKKTKNRGLRAVLTGKTACPWKPTLEPYSNWHGSPALGTRAPQCGGSISIRCWKLWGVWAFVWRPLFLSFILFFCLTEAKSPWK